MDPRLPASGQQAWALYSQSLGISFLTTLQCEVRSTSERNFVVDAVIVRLAAAFFIFGGRTRIQSTVLPAIWVLLG